VAGQWRIAEEAAAKHGKTMDRKKWRLVVTMHCAEDDELALQQVRAGERRETVDYFTEALGRPPGRSGRRLQSTRPRLRVSLG
jgi:limonene 1,2-monooxygenase